MEAEASICLALRHTFLIMYMIQPNIIRNDATWCTITHFYRNVSFFINPFLLTFVLLLQIINSAKSFNQTMEAMFEINLNEFLARIK